MSAAERLGLGGGCHWCTEAVFQALRGVSGVEQGFIRSTPPDDAPSEAVIVTFDPARIALEVLIEIHLRTHASTAPHRMRGKYRSAVYVFSAAQSRRVALALRQQQAGFDAPLVTRGLPFAGFTASVTRFHDYYATDPARPFCTRYIDPKLARLRQDYAAYLTAD